MLRVLVIGVGSIGERHLRCFRNTGRVELAFCEPNADRRQQVRDRYGVARAFADLDEALIDRWDAAVVCTPAHFHVPQAIRLAERGTHLLIEKPLATTLDGIDRLRETVERERCVAAVAYVLRTHPLVQSVREALISDRFGSPLQIVVNAGQHFPTYRPAYREIYYTRRETGGGAIQDAMTHLLNLGEFLVGPVDRLLADAAHLALPGVEVEDTVHVLTRHGPVMGCYALNQFQAPNETSVTLVCQRGTVRIEFHQNRWQWMREPGSEWQEGMTTALERDQLFEIQAHRFLDAIELGRIPDCTLEQGLQTLRVNLGILAESDPPGWTNVRNRNCGET
ncbi:MAG: Gfo/Idh/MocA family oxidoreductase [Planctomycetes bacterium]|nr:Gfo/Idh/MocA family oxidoreductase [Planctomycetota bacterium]